MTPRDLAFVARTRAALADGSAQRRRMAAGIRQGEFAAALGVSQSAVSQWESGRHVPDGPRALAYGRLLAAVERRAA